MHYIVISPENSNSFGGIFYNAPTEQEIDRIYEIIEEKCENLVEEKYAENLDMYCEAMERLAQELELMEQTRCAFEFFLAEAVLQYSTHEGYPIFAYSELAGSFIAYLLDISNFNPLVPETRIDVHMVWKWRNGKIQPPCFTLGIAPSIRDGLIHFLCGTPELCHIKVNREIYKFISTPNNGWCWKIGGLIRRTNSYYDNSISEKLSMSAFQAWIDEGINDYMKKNEVNKTIWKEEMFLLQSMKSIGTMDRQTFVKLYAYLMMGYKGKKTLDKLDRTDFYVFEEDLFSALLDLNIPKEKVAEMVFDKKVYAPLRDDMTYVNQLADYDVPETLLNYCSAVSSLWGKAPCISRVNMYYILEWYKQNYPVEYEEVVNGGEK